MGRKPVSVYGTGSSLETLNIKLRQWQPDIADRVRQSIAEIIELADADALDIRPSRVVEQEVLDLIDEPETCSQIQDEFLEQLILSNERKNRF